MRLTLTTALAVAVVLAAPLALAAQEQEPPAAEFGELIEVSEVLLDVLVTDRQGNVIIGLGPEDFLVEEDGTTIPLTSASFYSNRFRMRDEVAGIQHPLPNEVPADRYFIFFFHDQKRFGSEASRLISQQLQASRQCKRWVQKEMLPGDWVAVVSYDVKLKVHQDFTRDRDDLLEAIDDAVRGHDPGNVWSTRRTAGEIQPTLLKHLPAGNDLRDRTETIYEGLELLAEATREIVGRKSLIFLGTGFFDLEVLGRNTSTAVARPDERYYPDLVQALNDNNVAIYPVDLVPSEYESVQSNALTQLAGDTGGRYYGNFVNFLTPLQRIADENNGYYLLSYQAEHPAGEQGYREVKVKARNPEFVVRARQGYRYGT